MSDFFASYRFRFDALNYSLLKSQGITQAEIKSVFHPGNDVFNQGGLFLIVGYLSKSKIISVSFEFRGGVINIVDTNCATEDEIKEYYCPAREN